jgi:uncharacterized membrane protein
MGLMVLVLGLILFLAPHVLVTMRPQRAAVLKPLGERAYKGLFAALSIAGLYVTGKGFGMYETAGPLVLWTAPAWTRHVTEALMLPACIFVAAAYLSGQHQTCAQAPHAGRGENLGGGASPGQWRRRRDHPVRIGVGLGRL